MCTGSASIEHEHTKTQRSTHMQGRACVLVFPTLSASLCLWPWVEDGVYFNCFKTPFWHFSPLLSASAAHIKSLELAQILLFLRQVVITPLRSAGRVRLQNKSCALLYTLTFSSSCRVAFLRFPKENWSTTCLYILLQRWILSATGRVNFKNKRNKTTDSS